MRERLMPWSCWTCIKGNLLGAYASYERKKKHPTGFLPGITAPL